MYFPGTTDIVVKLLRGNLPPDLKFLSDILSGQVDADRMDYLLRDSLHCGVEYGNFDHSRLVECLSICRSDNGIELAIERGGVHALEALILARYYMFTQVYGHRTRRIYDIYFADFMSSLKLDFNPLTKVLNYDDISIMLRIRAKARWEQKNGILGVATRLVERQHHKKIYETSDFADVRDKQKANSLYNLLKEKFPQYEFIIDPEGCGGNIHKFYVNGDEEEGVYFHVIADNGDKRLISEESKIIGKISKKFRAIRIYVNQNNPEILREIYAQIG